jgi:F-box and WD-40 domain protein 1/11
LPGHSGIVLSVQFDASPEEDVLISGSADESVIIWRFSTSEIIHTIKNAHNASVTYLKFDLKYLVTASRDKLIKIWNRHEIRPTDDEFYWFSLSLEFPQPLYRETQLFLAIPQSGPFQAI